MLYEILKTSKLGASFAPDMYTALWAQKLARDGEVKTLSGAPPLSFQANGTPLLDYLISGNTVQSGTPTPDNPIMPVDTGDLETSGAKAGQYKIPISNSGENLFDKESQNIIQNKYLRDNGNLDASSNHIVSDFMPISGAYITISNVSVSNTTSHCFYDNNKNFISSFKLEKIPKTIEIPSNAKFIRCTVLKAKINDFMLNLGSEALPYEPYHHTTTPVYLGEVETTRKIKKLVLTGEENITLHSVKNGIVGVRIPTSANVKGASEVICTHCNGDTWTAYNGDNRPYSIIVSNPADGNAVLYMTAPDSEHNTLETFIQWVTNQYNNGTPIEIWYVQQTETIGIVNEPLRKIGEYADTVSMEQANVEIPTARGTNTLDVLTDVKPSNVYLKYKEV